VNPNPDPDPGFWCPKIEKNSSWKNWSFFEKLWIRTRIQWGPWIRIRAKEVKNDTKIEKSKKKNFLEVLDVLFLGLKASLVAWTSIKEA
jgi:hypothetical protein